MRRDMTNTVSRYSACRFEDEASAMALAEKAKPGLVYALKASGYGANIRFDGPRQGIFEATPEVWGMAAYGDAEESV